MNKVISVPIRLIILLGIFAIELVTLAVLLPSAQYSVQLGGTAVVMSIINMPKFLFATALYSGEYKKNPRGSLYAYSVVMGLWFILDMITLQTLFLEQNGATVLAIPILMFWATLPVFMIIARVAKAK